MEEEFAPAETCIKPIDAASIHRICSGQVVLSLAVAIKELVENAIDASATNVEIRLANYGCDSLEVADNGTGIRPENFQALTLKHYTSKIREFADLESVETLGFRGEALSSLCALAELVVLTRHTLDEHATRLKFDSNGKISEKTVAAREVGTTVTLANLFASLPVRRKEFTKHLKREYAKTCQLLSAYCLVSKGIKFTCSNLVNGTRTTVLTTEGSRSIRANIVSVFGPKQVASLVQLDVAQPSQQVLDEYKVTLTPGEPLPFTFDCHISPGTHGSGRSTADRQFFYVNSRPCEPCKVAKLVNATYRQFNPNQYPFVFLNVLADGCLVDVNVTPDKRTVFVKDENILLAVLKSALLDAYKTCPSSYAVQNLGLTADKGVKRPSGVGLTGFLKKIKAGHSNSSERIDIDLSIQTGQSESLAETDQSADDLPPTIIDQSLYHKPAKTDRLTVQTANKPTVDKTTKIDVIIQETSVTKPPRPTITALVSLKRIKDWALAYKSAKNVDSSSSILVKFRSRIDPASNDSALKELRCQMRKDDFKSMTVVGQFNLGFIIAQLRDDLFIIDQHASDEKYNFEMLQLETTLTSQPLIRPRPMELTAANEEILMENLEVFEKNGFKFAIEPDAPATKKASLTAIPISKNCVFDKSDVEEILFMLQDGLNPGLFRPSRVQLMFATRACRKSVMIGCPLDKKAMRKLVEHMGELEQPWNCPHGRPTIRHLINLKLLDNK